MAVILVSRDPFRCIKLRESRERERKCMCVCVFERERQSE